MRPTRLELHGFGSFREPTTIDFAEVDLFVLVGPTGAGKSTVIDALIFALYGSVPRYDDKRLVAPVVNQGLVEAKVRLDFVIDDAGYTAVRVVRRTAKGATTKEARLERWDATSGEGPDGHTTTVAGNEKELTDQIERLLGLSFEHFTRCVVLPQGAFAQFMHARASERQNLLVELLGVDVYRRIARRARERAKQAQTRIAHTRRRLDGELADATPNARAAAAQRVEQLGDVHRSIVEAQPELEALRERGAELRAAANAARVRRELLDGIVEPSDVAELSTRLDTVGDAEAEARRAVQKAEQQRESAERLRAELPDAAVLTEAQRLHAEVTVANERIAPAAAALAKAQQAQRDAEAAQRDANQVLVSSRTARDQVRDAHQAAALARGLRAGDDCPVCARPLDATPTHDDVDDLDAADRALAQAEQAAARAADTLRSATAAVARAQHAHQAAQTSSDDVDRRLAQLLADNALDRTDLARVATAAAEADRDLATARREEQTARASLRNATAAVAELDTRRRSAWDAFDGVRDKVAALGPPSVDRDDLAGAWRTLTAWVDDCRPALDRDASDAAEAVAAVAAQWRAENGALIAACTAADITVDGNDPLTASTAALERAKGTLAAVTTAVETADRLRSEIGDDERLADAADGLGRHLGTKGFEQWLLNQALEQLVVDASVRLRALSSGAYSLQVDDAGGFQVVDHRNADELRPAKTLSGGETFLASLSLALSLADHVTQLATGTSARLDALFLDEGFGTLDHDTLDVVAVALEELGAQGRMVGLVTHVRELAERMPVRYEIRRAGETSTVRKVDA